MLWSWGLWGKAHDSLESADPPLVSKQWRKPNQQIQDPTLAGPCWISRSCLITAADETQKLLV